MKRFALCAVGLLFVLVGYSQTRFKLSSAFHSRLSVAKTDRIVGALDRLLFSIGAGKIDTTLLEPENIEFHYNFFRDLQGIENKDTVAGYFHPQLVNLYPLTETKCMLTLVLSKGDELGRIYNILVREKEGHLFFASPLYYNTRFWKTTTVGSVRYFFPDSIDMQRAELFDRKNKTIAQKLELPLRHWDVYLCQNFQEALNIQGCVYEYSRNGVVNSGYIVDPCTLFACMHDEDFSHDILHIYAAGIRGNQRNRIAECGLAYYWGNAYYTTPNAKSPALEELLPAFQKYLDEHKGAQLLSLFEKNPDVLAEYGYPKPIEVNKIIAALICREIERKKGEKGIIELLKCGRGNNNFFRVVEQLIGLNHENFDSELRRLVSCQ